MLKNFFGWFRKTTNTEHEVCSDEDSDEFSSDDDLLNGEHKDATRNEEMYTSETASSNEEVIQVFVEHEQPIPDVVCYQSDIENHASVENCIPGKSWDSNKIKSPDGSVSVTSVEDESSVETCSTKIPDHEPLVSDDQKESSHVKQQPEYNSLDSTKEDTSLVRDPSQTTDSVSTNSVEKLHESSEKGNSLKPAKQNLTKIPQNQLSCSDMVVEPSVAGNLSMTFEGNLTTSENCHTNDEKESKAAATLQKGHVNEKTEELEKDFDKEEFCMADESVNHLDVTETEKKRDEIMSVSINSEKDDGKDKIMGEESMEDKSGSQSVNEMETEDIIVVSVSSGTCTSVEVEDLPSVIRSPDTSQTSALKLPEQVKTKGTEFIREEESETKQFVVKKTRRSSSPRGGIEEEEKPTSSKSGKRRLKVEKISSDEDEESTPPGEPCERGATSSSITIAWEPPKQGYDSVDYYEIKYRESGRKRKRWTSRLTEERKETVTVTDLIGDTEYEFKVRSILSGGEEGPFSNTSKPIRTRFSLAKLIASQYETIKISNGPPIVYKVPIREKMSARNCSTMTRKCVYGPVNHTAREKTIMLVGATGAGKSTLIDGMINYITDVSWEDEFRFSMIDLTEDELRKKGNEANSQTEWITCYSVNHRISSPLEYTLNIIDTPGFGDTRGLQRDKKIVDQIRGFFETPGENGVTGIDAVCFVTQAPLARLTPSQRYIFDAILSVFGADIASNIFVLITFADGHDPPVKAALEEAKVPFSKAFKFNNSALFSSTADSEADFGKMFWSMGKESFKKFFDELGRVEQKSLWMTTKVLELRHRLEATIQGLQPQIEEGLNKLNIIKQEQEVLRRHKAEIEANKDFTYEVEEIYTYQEPTDPGTYITNCLKCNRTCHYPCLIPNDEAKKRCSSIDPDTHLCLVCPLRCHWKLHKNNNFRYVTYTMKVQKTYEQLKEKYHIAQDQEKKTRDVLGKVKESFKEMGKQVNKMVSEVRRCINQLNEIALRPNPLSDLDYIDILIENEKNEKKYGWDNRVELYQKARKEAELVKRAGETNFSPWDNVDDILIEM